MTDIQTVRIPPLAPPYDEGPAQALALMMPPDRGVEPLNLFRTFVRDMPFVAAMGPLGRFMLSGRASGGAAFDLRSREIVIDRVCARCACEYEWGVHIASYADKAGLTAEQVYSTVHGSGRDACWDARGSALMDMVDELHDTGALTDSTYTALAAFFNADQIMELLALSGWYHAIAYMANGMRVEPEHWAPRFPSLQA